jgi:hypothetical protein
MMKLSKETTEILKNFATINPSLIFKTGSVQKTISPQKTVLAIANVSESFDKEFAIYDLTKFISTVSSFEDPELKLGADTLIVTNGKNKAEIRYAKSDLIQAPADKTLSLSSTEISFTLEATALQSAIRFAGILGLPEIALIGRNGVAYLAAIDSRTEGSDNFECEVGKAEANYRMIFKIDNLKLLPRDYEVRVSAKGLSHFKSKANDIEYWIAAEQSSKYGE